MIIYKEILSRRRVDVICDICKKSCKNKCSSLAEDTSLTEYATLDAIWGYCSKKDGQRVEIHFCEDCFDKVNAYIDELKNEKNTIQC